MQALPLREAINACVKLVAALSREPEQFHHMSSTLARTASLPQLSPRWITSDAATAQSDRNEGVRAAREDANGPSALSRFWRSLMGN